MYMLCYLQKFFNCSIRLNKCSTRVYLFIYTILEMNVLLEYIYAYKLKF